MPVRVFVLLLCLLTLGLRAQPVASFEVINTEQGLSQGMVFDILQSRDGYLWVATKDGLNRFDGYRCKVFSPDPFDPFAIGGSEIRKLYEDSRGWIWLSYPKGIDIYVPQSGHFFHLPKSNIPIFTGWENASSPLNFAETPDGAVWITDESRLWHIAPPDAAVAAAEKAGNAHPVLTIEALPLRAGPDTVSARAFGVFFSHRHGLLAGTGHGLFAIDWASRKVRLAAFAGKPLDIVGEDPSGRLWLRAAKAPVDMFPPVAADSDLRLAVWDGKQGIVSNFNIVHANRIRLDSAGRLWILHAKTLRKWRPDALLAGGQAALVWACDAPFTQIREFDYQALSIDRSGIVWLGTNGYGILKVNSEKTKFARSTPLLSQRRIFEDPMGRLYFSADPRWLYADARFEQKTPNPWFDAQTGLVPAVFDAQGNGWRLSADRLYRIDAQGRVVRSYPMRSFEVLACRNRPKIMGVSEQALLEFDIRTEQLRQFPFKKPLLERLYYSHLMYEDADGTIWIFGFEGLIRATPHNDGYRFSHYKNNPANRNSLSNDVVLCVADDPLEPGRYLWTGTKGGGLNRLDKKTGDFKHYKMEQGLPDNVVYGALPDNGGHLWLSTNKGLCRFHTRKETTRNFTASDGLQGNEFNTGSYLKTRRGFLIFGGVNGLTAFHPDSLRFNTVVPQTHIVNLAVNNLPFPLIGHTSLALSHRQNVLTFEFAALEFSNPAQNRYRYQLLRQGIWGEGGADKWVELGYKNTVQFADLSPGRYTFRVLGSNNDGVWGAAPAELAFTIRPPWWAAWWAYFLYFAAAAALAWAFYRAQLRRRIEQQEALRLRELDTFKNRFFTNITHEFRTPLTVILGMTEQLTVDGGQLTDGDAKGKLGLIKRSGENLLRLVNQILDLAKLESGTLALHYVQGDVLPYLRYIVESLHSLANARNVLLRVESTQTSIVMDYDPERLLQIVYNLLSNAIKFTPGGGKVTLRAGLLNLEGLVNLDLQVSDTGIGIPPDDLPHIFDRFFQANNLEKAKAGGTGIGLALTKELVQMMGGTIAVQSEPGKGSTFTVRLPVTRKAAEMPIDRVTSSHPVNRPPSPPDTADAPQILIVEDNPDVVEYLAACLSAPSVGGDRREAYQLAFAYNGRAGIEKALDGIPDLIVSDVMMPEKDGFELCETLKNDERTSHIPIILLTAKAGVENRIAGLRRGADAYLAKPFHQEELLVTLANLLEIRRKLQQKYRDTALESAAHRSPAHLLIPLPDPEDAFLKKVNAAVLEHLSDTRFTVDDLCRALAMSQPQLHRKLTALTGKNATLFIRSVRLARAKELLLRKEKNVSEVAYEVGFDDPKYFSRVFSEEFGVAPSKI